MSSPASGATRDGYGKALVRLGEEHPDVVALDADLAESTRSCWFAEKFPDRFFQAGISEQDMVGMAAGLAASGKVPYASTFAIFGERAFEQFRNMVARPKMNVKYCGSHGGLLTGQDGSSAQAIEDLGIYRGLPNVTVLCPSDIVEAEMATIALYDLETPSYTRTTRAAVPVTHEPDTPFKIGLGEVMEDGADATLIAIGAMVPRALEARDQLKRQGLDVGVVNMPTLKPLDVALVEKVARQTGHLITCEDHSIIGGLGSAVAEAVVETYPCKMARVGVQDTFGESGRPEELYQKYGLTPEHVSLKVQELLGPKEPQVVPS